MIVKTTLKELFTNLQKYLSGTYSRYFIADKTCISYGLDNDIDLDYCKVHKIPAYNLKRDGGCIVYAKGNVAWGDVRRNDNKEFVLPNIKFINDFVDYLNNKGIKAYADNNDIMIDGYKVASGCAINLPPDWKLTYSSVQISINQDLKTIKNVCKKEMNKVPKGLSEFGVTTDEVEQFVIKWFEEN